MENVTQEDIDRLADIVWYLEGYKAATDASFENCAFDGTHINALNKISRVAKQNLYADKEKKDQ